MKKILISALVITLSASAIIYFSRKSNSITPIPDYISSASELREQFGDAYTKTSKKEGKVVTIDITAEESEVEIIDGVKTKVWTYNNISPGPELRIALGDTLKLNLKNNLEEDTTIHWHGVRVSNDMDGVPGVNQEAVKPGDTFTYTIKPKDAGTYWYHPHYNNVKQIENGLYGTLIVEDDTSDKYSRDITWVVDDWLLDNNAQVDQNFMTQHELAHDGRQGNVVTVNSSRETELIVDKGERVRLRLVNSSNARIYNLSLKNLDATVIAVDGLYVREPFPFKDFTFAPGNRVDLDISVPVDFNSEAILFDKDAKDLSTITSTSDVVETPVFDFPSNDRIPEWKDAIFADTTQKYNLEYRAEGGGHMGMGGEIKWVLDEDVYPNTTTDKFKIDKFNKIEFNNTSDRVHPMHLHGIFFKVVSINNKPVDEGFFRDTYVVNPNDKVEIAFIPMEEGVWAHHCHILEHAEAGMMTLFEV